MRRDGLRKRGGSNQCKPDGAFPVIEPAACAKSGRLACNAQAVVSILDQNFSLSIAHGALDINKYVRTAFLLDNPIGHSGSV